MCCDIRLETTYDSNVFLSNQFTKTKERKEENISSVTSEFANAKVHLHSKKTVNKKREINKQ